MVGTAQGRGLTYDGPLSAALAAARALAAHSDLDARSIAEKSMAIASEICLYTNANIVIEEL